MKIQTFLSSFLTNFFNDKEKQNNEEADEEHVESTVHTGNQLKIPVKGLKLGVDDGTSTLATQETLVKKIILHHEYPTRNQRNNK